MTKLEELKKPKGGQAVILKRAALGIATAAMLAGIGHNMPPATYAATQSSSKTQAVLPRRIVDENRRNQKLRQKLRRQKRLQLLHRLTRAQRKTRKFGSGYRPGKLFKGHRV
jgi:hypothetical protein